jgi:hypothetical protein
MINHGTLLVSLSTVQDIIAAAGTRIDGSLHLVVLPLLKRAAPSSVGGRDNFMASEADAALAALVQHASGVKLALALISCVPSANSGPLRCKLAGSLDACLQR